MQKKVEFNYKFLVFLYAYLRQANLSLDRSRWEGLNDLRVYYASQIAPAQVMSYFEKVCGKISKATFPIFISPSVNFIKQRFIATWGYYYSRKHYLNSKEVVYCYELLRELKYLLDSDIHKYELETEKLRIDIAKFASNVLVGKLLSKDIRLGNSVEHYLQNVEVISIQEFLKDVDL